MLSLVNVCYTRDPTGNVSTIASYYGLRLIKTRSCFKTSMRGILITILSFDLADRNTRKVSEEVEMATGCWVQNRFLF
jgi:hypothetical protein